MGSKTLSDKEELKECPNCKIKHISHVRTKYVKEFIRWCLEHQNHTEPKMIIIPTNMFKEIAGDKLI